MSSFLPFTTIWFGERASFLDIFWAWCRGPFCFCSHCLCYLFHKLHDWLGKSAWCSKSSKTGLIALLKMKRFDKTENKVDFPSSGKQNCDKYFLLFAHISSGKSPLFCEISHQLFPLLNVILLIEVVTVIVTRVINLTKSLNQQLSSRKFVPYDF